MKYTIEIGVTGKFVTEVDADSEEKALDIAETKYSEADSGDFDIYDGEWICINDKYID